MGIRCRDGRKYQAVDKNGLLIDVTSDNRPPTGRKTNEIKCKSELNHPHTEMFS
jgi:hypothetical protein